MSGDFLIRGDGLASAEDFYKRQENDWPVILNYDFICVSCPDNCAPAMSTFSSHLTAAVIFVALLGSCTNMDALTKRGSSVMRAGTAAGAVVSGFATRVYGKSVVHAKSAYASSEKWLKACIAEARAANRRFRGYNGSLSSKISRLRSEVASAKASGDTNKLRQKKAEIQKLQKENSQEMARLDGEIINQQNVLNQESNSTLQQEVISLRSTRGTMSNNYDRLARLNREIDV